MSKPLVDLRVKFGDRYRIAWEAGGSTRSAWPKPERSWLLELLCRYGIIYPHGGEILSAWTDHPRIGRELERLRCVPRSRGDLETVAVFPVDDATDVFRILKLCRRRCLSDTQRAQTADLLARARLERHRESLSESEFLAAASTRLRPRRSSSRAAFTGAE